MGLYQKYRPKRLKDVHGQSAAVNALQSIMASKHGTNPILFTGPSGSGKTTLARIYKNHIGCSDMDFVELNAANFKGIDTVRDIIRDMNLSPMKGPVRMWLIDECHKMTNDAQNAFLKSLEDVPSHVRFCLATTDSPKLLKTLVSRCHKVQTKLLAAEDLKKVLKRVMDKESVTLDKEVIDKIIDCSEGSARQAIVLLETVASVKGKDAQLACIEEPEAKQQAIDLVRALMKVGAKWIEISKMLKKIDEDPEMIRRLVLSYASSVILNSGHPRAYLVLTAFRDNFFDCGKAGLIAACYEVCTN